MSSYPNISFKNPFVDDKMLHNYIKKFFPVEMQKEIIEELTQFGNHLENQAKPWAVFSF
ncbi:MAG: hypothetical protein HAW60_03380 [Bdellovibrionales bacterium]|nr:hypothetical protein [Bdellovibrionales bacterium]